MKQARPTVNPSPDNPPAPDSDQDSVAILSSFLNWLAYFTLYLGAVAVVCATGLYFLWQLPIPQDLSQLFRNAGHSSSRPLAAVAPPTASAKLPTSPLQPLANPATIPSSDAPEIAAATPPPTTNIEADSDPNAPPLVVESPAADGQTDPAVTVEVAPTEEPPPPTPQVEIKQLLTEAQQQMDSRRLTAPASGNALQSYQRILELEPDNADARAGIDRIAAHYRDIAEQSLSQGRPDESLAYIGRGLRATPQNQDLLNLRRQARLIQQQREQAQLEEMRRQQAEQELAEQQYQERLRQQRIQEQQQPWWQQPPAYDNSSGFNQR
jgi:hypothetical protein